MFQLQNDLSSPLFWHLPEIPPRVWEPLSSWCTELPFSVQCILLGIWWPTESSFWCRHLFGNIFYAFCFKNIPLIVFYVIFSYTRNSFAVVLARVLITVAELRLVLSLQPSVPSVVNSPAGARAGPCRGARKLVSSDHSTSKVKHATR